MTEYEARVKSEGESIEAMTKTHGWELLREQIDYRIRELWGDFIALDPEAKISCLSHEIQGRHNGYKEIVEWVDEMIEKGRRGPQPGRAGLVYSAVDPSVGGNPNETMFPFSEISCKLQDGSVISLDTSETREALQYSPTVRRSGVIPSMHMCNLWMD